MTDSPALQPTRDPRATLPDLIEVLLNKGVYLDLDLIISVADVPLIGVNLRATIAGIETMLEYGMMRQWDEQTRAWVQKSLKTHLPMADGEEVVAKMAGGHYQDSFHRTWRPGSAYITSQRLLIHRRDPAETLWQAELSTIESIRPHRQRSVGGEERTRIRVVLADGSASILSAVEPERLIALVQEQRGVAGEEGEAEALEEEPAVLREGRMWLLESLSDGGVWRAGRARLTHDEGLVWKSPMDGRALVRAPRVHSLRLEEHENPTDRADTLLVGTPGGTVRMAAEDVGDWEQTLQTWQDERDSGEEERDGTEH